MVAMEGLSMSHLRRMKLDTGNQAEQSDKPCSGVRIGSERKDECQRDCCLEVLQEFMS